MPLVVTSHRRPAAQANPLTHLPRVHHSVLVGCTAERADGHHCVVEGCVVNNLVASEVVEKRLETVDETGKYFIDQTLVPVIPLFHAVLIYESWAVQRQPGHRNSCRSGIGLG